MFIYNSIGTEFSFQITIKTLSEKEKEKESERQPKSFTDSKTDSHFGLDVSCDAHHLAPVQRRLKGAHRGVVFADARQDDAGLAMAPLLRQKSAEFGGNRFVFGRVALEQPQRLRVEHVICL